MNDQEFKEEQQARWQGVFRGSVLSSMVGKHVSYVGFVDHRAQGIIAINSFLVPIAFSGIDNYQTAATIAILTALGTIVTAVLALYPKDYSGNKKEEHPNLLHFSKIKNLSEEDYMAQMQKETADNSRLTELIAHDLYHLSTKVLAPKFYWLKISYSIFLVGNIVAVAIALITAGAL